MNPSRAPRVAAFFLAAVLLGGCHSGGAGGGSAPPTTAPGRATTLFASGAVVPGSLAVLPATANGTVAAVRSIQSAVSNFGESFYVALDGSGNVWVTSCQDNINSAGPVLAFKTSANGSNVPPAVNIAGSNTGLSGCQLGIAIDGSGNAYVADNTNTTAFPGGQIAIFGAGQTGNVAPVRRIAGAAANFHAPSGVALDGGGNIYVADSGQGFAGFAGDVQVFVAGATGNVAATRVISGSGTGLLGPEGIAFDTSGNLYVANAGNNTITVYASNATGNAAPLRTISGSATKLNQPNGVALDGAGYLYVGTEATTPSNGPILVFAPGASGNATPVQSITVNATRFAEPAGVAVQ